MFASFGQSDQNAMTKETAEKLAAKGDEILSFLEANKDSNDPKVIALRQFVELATRKVL